MDEKNLPIRFFSMRDNDERKTEGAGDSDIPNWVDRGCYSSKADIIYLSYEWNGGKAFRKKQTK